MKSEKKKMNIFFHFEIKREKKTHWIINKKIEIKIIFSFDLIQKKKIDSDKTLWVWERNKTKPIKKK